MPETPSRRRFLQAGLTLIPVVSLSPHAVFAATKTPEEAAREKPRSAYSPRYFTVQEWAFINAATVQLIPQDELGPDAVACGIPEFIDRQMETPYAHGALWYMQGPFLTDLAPELGYQQKFTPRDIYRFGIKACNEWCTQSHGKLFSDLNVERQINVLHQLEAGAVPMTDMNSVLFFSQLLKNTKEGYFADPLYGGNQQMAGWKAIGFPGARADYMDWIDHPNERYPLGPVSIDGGRS